MTTAPQTAPLERRNVDATGTVPSPTASAPLRGVRIGWLDSLRGIAATSVFVAHYMAFNYVPFRQASREYFHWGAFGVFLFMCISGFVIPMSVERSASLKGFWTSRFWRLFPLYWTVMVAYTVYFHLAHSPRAPSLREVGIDATMLPFLFVSKSMVFGGWTLSIELIFYVTISILFAARLLRHSTAIAYGALAVTVACLFTVPMTDFETVFLFTIPFAGTVLYRIHSGAVGKSAWICVAAYASLFVILSITSGADPNSDWYRGKAISGIVTFGLFVLALAWPHRLSASKPLLWLGKVSYSTYLWHITAITIGMKLFTHVRLPILLWLIMNGICSLALALIMSAFSYRHIEQPAMALGRRLLCRKG